MSSLALLAVGIWFVVQPPGSGRVEPGLLAFLAAFGLTPFIRLMARRSGALDHPDDRKAHPSPTPRLGGVAVIAAFVLAIGRGPLLDHEMMAIVVAALVLMLVGAIDDTRGVSAGLRLALQVACAVAVIAAGVRLNLVPGPYGLILNVVLSVVWIIGITNAYNFIDGMDGLAASLGAVIALLLALVGQGAAHPAIPEVCLALAGALLGFLPHNLPRRGAATIFLGDSGSASIGFLLATLAIKEDWAEGDPLVALTAPVLIFSVLIYDMIQTTVSRIASGRVRSFRGWIEYVGRDHIHHRFTALLGSPRRALLLILMLAVGLGLSALGLKRGASGEALLFLVHGALVMAVVAVLEGAAIRHRETRDRPPDSP